MESGTRDKVQELGRRWTDAELRADTAALDSLLDRDFVAVGPLGFILTREEWIDRHRSGDLKYQALTWEETGARQFGDAVIVIGTQTQRATYQGNEVPGGQFRVTQILIQRDGRWLPAGVHLSPIAQRPS